jgi:segregation and condensation protein A
MDSQNLELSGEFMVLAAILIELKSRMLLPRLKTDETSEEDPRKELVQKLLEYKKFRKAAELLLEQESLAAMVFEKPKEDLLPYTGEPDIYLRMDINHFIKAFKQFLLRQERIEEVKRGYERIERQRVSVEYKIDSIRRRFEKKKVKRLKFADLLDDINDKYDIVLTFAALLEMIRGRELTASQSCSFAEISVAVKAGKPVLGN